MSNEKLIILKPDLLEQDARPSIHYTKAADIVAGINWIRSRNNPMPSKAYYNPSLAIPFSLAYKKRSRTLSATNPSSSNNLSKVEVSMLGGQHLITLKNLILQILPELNIQVTDTYTIKLDQTGVRGLYDNLNVPDKKMGDWWKKDVIDAMTSGPIEVVKLCSTDTEYNWLHFVKDVLRFSFRFQGSNRSKVAENLIHVPDLGKETERTIEILSAYAAGKQLPAIEIDNNYRQFIQLP